MKCVMYMQCTPMNQQKHQTVNKILIQLHCKVVGMIKSVKFLGELFKKVDNTDKIQTNIAIRMLF